jgi:hypothetical protein
MAGMQPGTRDIGKVLKRGLPALLSFLYLVLFAQAQANAGLRIPLNDAGIFNPDQGPVAVGYELQKDAQEVAVRIRDFRGQIVNQYRFIELLTGDQIFEWDGLDQNEKQLPDGGYELIFEVQFKDGSRGRGIVNVRLADIKPPAGTPAPENLPPEKHDYKISGSLSSFWRHDGEDHEDTGQLRARTQFSYQDDRRRVNGVFSAIDTYPGGASNYDASQAFVEQNWTGGRIKGIFREGLGGFDDPINIFSDFKSERKKVGFRIDQHWGALYAAGLGFTSEGDVDSEESGGAARLQYGAEGEWQWGASYTYRRARLPENPDDWNRNRALAADLRVPILEPLTLLMEFIHTDDTERSNAIGFSASAQYDQGRLRMAAGYIDLGEDFAADFANPLNGITRDSRGIQASLDFAMPMGGHYLRNPYLTARVFDLQRHSDHQKLREIDTSLRFGIGARDTFLLSWYGQDNEDGPTNTFLGTLTHRWNDQWASSLQVNNIDGDDNGTWRFTLDTMYQREQHNVRVALEWIQRTIDDSKLSSNEQTNLRLAWDNTLWGVQLQTRYSQNEDDNGYNFFGRLEYRPRFLHRYQVITYASLGDRAAFEFEKRMEVGMELRF